MSLCSNISIINRSDLYDSDSMAPSAENTSKILGRLPYSEDTFSKERQRPPIYNPEDYATLLKKWGKKSSNLLALLYASSKSTNFDTNRSQHDVYRDYSNPMLMSAGSEMTLRQFGSVSELLTKLKSDLRLSYLSFVQEFVTDPLDGITLLLDLLRAIQLSQSTGGGSQNANGSITIGKIPPLVQRRTLLDELSCLQCIQICCTRYSEAVRKLTASSAGLFTLTVCIMSNVNKSRIIALQLLSRACEPPTNGHSAVSEAISTLRLRFGEPVRFRFLVGMLTSTGNQKELLTAGIKFLNTFLRTASSDQKRLYLQAELDQAGFDIAAIRKNIGPNTVPGEPLLEQLDIWEKKFIDVELITRKLEAVKKDNDNLRDAVLLLERKVQILHEEKGELVSVERFLKEKCSELQEEVHSLKSGMSQKVSTYLQDKKDSSTPEDEGISSSERSLTPEDNTQQHPLVYDLYGMHCTPVLDSNEPQANDEDQETNIDQIIEELTNMANNAENEVCSKEMKKKADERKRTEEAQIASKLKMRIEVDDYALTNENEIIPCNLHPQPPRKTKSFVQLFLPMEEYDYCNKEFFFENETAFTSDEGSDSLLSGSKFYKLHLHTTSKPDQKDDTFKPKPAIRTNLKRCESFKHINKSSSGGKAWSKNSFDFSRHFRGDTETTSAMEFAQSKTKCKSLDRINEGIDSFVNVIVTNKVKDNLSKSDSGNVSGISIMRACNILMSSKEKDNSRLSLNSEEKQKMFLPTRTDHNEIPYYFPRIQEKRSSTNSSFLIRRGHGNAGLYSGQIVISNQHSYLAKTRDLIHNKDKNCIISKVTDLPSGLY